MAVIITDIELLTPLIVFALGLVFGILGVSRKSEIYCMLSTVSWFILASLWAYLGADTVAAVVSYLFMGFGWLFLVFTFVLVVQNMDAYRKQKRAEEDLD
jgi:uncharacterized membrane protein